MPNMAPLLEAVKFAADKHRNQRRKDESASPYINHPITVAFLISGVGKVENLDILLAAILHDTIEDTETTPEEIDRSFGPSVRRLVQEVTDDKSLPKQERKRLQVKHAPQLSQGAKLIKLGDKICNVIDVTHSPPAEWSLRRRREYLDWTAKVIEGCRGINAALAEHYDRVLEEGRRKVQAGEI